MKVELIYAFVGMNLNTGKSVSNPSTTKCCDLPLSELLWHTLRGPYYQVLDLY